MALYLNGDVLCVADASRSWDAASCSAIAQMDKGHVVNVKVRAGNAKLLGHTGANGLTGFLYYALD